MSGAGAWVGALLALSACTPTVRLGRAFAPEGFVMPSQPVGRSAELLVDPGFKDTAIEPFVAPIAFEEHGETFVSPVWVTDRGLIEVRPLLPGAELTVYTRHVGLEERDFAPVVTRSGSLPRRLPTVVRPMPTGPLDGPYQLRIRDLQATYSDDPLEDGDLVLLEVTAPSLPPERYLFRAFDFGLQTRPGVSVLARVPLPFASQQDVGLSPVLALNLAIGWRFRSRNPAASFLGEEVAVIASVGVGNTAFETQLAAGDLEGAFNAALAGGGLELLQMFSVVVLGNASAPFRDDLEAGWTLAVGLDAVQLARFLDGLGGRLTREHPLAEDAAR